MDKDFIDRATRRGDLCFGVFHSEQLVSYSWYARNFIEAEDHVGVSMSFPSDTCYMFNAFTDPEFRGRQLFSLGVALASKELASAGVAKMITTVNRSNFASLRSCRRLGFAVLGKIWTVGRGTRRIALTPSAAGDLGIRFGGR
jgi:ribosomal protein S18 acetylase RimI-like enzyme